MPKRLSAIELFFGIGLWFVTLRYAWRNEWLYAIMTGVIAVCATIIVWRRYKAVGAKRS